MPGILFVAMHIYYIFINISKSVVFFTTNPKYSPFSYKNQKEEILKNQILTLCSLSLWFLCYSILS